MTNPTWLHSMVLFAAGMAVLFAAAHDVAVRTVPNGVSLIVAAAGLALHALDGQLLAALFGGGLVFAGAWCCWRRGWIGGGDVKLLSACAMLVAPVLVPQLLLSTALAGGVLALSYVPSRVSFHAASRLCRPVCCDVAAWFGVSAARSGAG